MGVGQARLESRNPVDGRVLASFAVADEDDVAAAVARARVAATWWGELGFSGRRQRLARLRVELASRLNEIAGLVHRENGKPRADAVLEIVLVIEHLDWALRHAASVLGARRRAPGLLMANQSAELAYRPLGVVGVIGPWNYPVYTPMGSIVSALASGNSVVFKPSEHTPATGWLLGEIVARAIGEHRLVEVVHGGGATGAALCRSGVDKLAFTGSTPTGRRVMAACAENLTPLVLELGGKDALLVDADADVSAAAEAAVWGAMQNAGQACISVERAYVVESVYEQFVEEVRERASRIVLGEGDDAEIGPITMPGQVDVIRRHLDDAFARGARAVVGGLDAVHAPWVDPVVLVDVPEEALVLREETFGPVLPVVRVRDMDEAVRRANAGRYGLGATVFSRRNGGHIAARLRAGMTSVNGVISYAAVPSLPFGGVGDSGFGRVHGEDGLREFSRPHAVVTERVRLPVPVMSFDRPRVLNELFVALTRLRHGR